MVITDTTLTLTDTINSNNTITLNACGVVITQPDKQVVSYTPLQGNTIYQNITNGNYQLNIGAIIYIPQPVQDFEPISYANILKNIANSQYVSGGIKQLLSQQFQKIVNFNQYGRIVNNAGFPNFNNFIPPDPYTPKRYSVPLEDLATLLNVLNSNNIITIQNQIINSLGLSLFVSVEGIDINIEPGTTQIIQCNFILKESPVEDDISLIEPNP